MDFLILGRDSRPRYKKISDKSRRDILVQWVRYVITNVLLVVLTASVFFRGLGSATYVASCV